MKEPLKMVKEQRSMVAMLLVCLALLAQQADARAVAVFSIQRHGARNVLPKNATLQENESNGGPALLPQGQRQCYEAGAAFRQRYVDPEACAAAGLCLREDDGKELYGVVGADGVVYNSLNTVIRSSALDRTVMSANSYFTGIFPPVVEATNTTFLPSGVQLVPILSKADPEDYIIRGYTKCPNYEKNLVQWFASDEFKAKENETLEFRNSISSIAPLVNVSLSNFWNVYDAFNVWQTYGVGDPLPELPQPTFTQVQELANWLETAKMRSNLTENLLGGALLAEVGGRLAEAKSAFEGGTREYFFLFSVSSHYNTLLGVLSAMGADTVPTAAEEPWFRKIPALAAVMVFELLTDDEGSNFAVRLVNQDGPKANYTVLELPCAVAGDAAETLAGPGACTFESFEAMVAERGMPTSQDWCKACNNTRVPECQVHDLTAQLTVLTGEGSTTSSGGGGGGGDNGLPWKIAVTAVATALGTAFLTTVACVWWQHRHKTNSFAGDKGLMRGLSSG